MTNILHGSLSPQTFYQVHFHGEHQHGSHSRQTSNKFHFYDQHPTRFSFMAHIQQCSLSCQNPTRFISMANIQHGSLSWQHSTWFILTTIILNATETYLYTYRNFWSFWWKALPFLQNITFLTESKHHPSAALIVQALTYMSVFLPHQIFHLEPLPVVSSEILHYTKKYKN